MAWIKRIVLFSLVNIAVVVMVSVILNLLGIGRYQTAAGLNHGTLLVFCLVWGMVGSVISLFLSKPLAKWTMGVRVIDPLSGGREGELLRTVQRLSQSAGLAKTPEVGIYPGSELNAFATGATRNSSLVAVSEGLLRYMDKEEVEGVLAHEVAHIANGDMVTMTLIQGVINAFVMYAARVIAYLISQFMRGEEDQQGAGLNPLVHSLVVMALEIVFGLIGSIIVASFSRYREFRADAGGAKLAGRSKMIAALRKLQVGLDMARDEAGSNSMAAFKISQRPSKFLALFSTHPPLERRIEKLNTFGI